MLYDQYFIDDLKDRADLVRLIEPYAPLKKKGANWMGCCPFHQEKTPSFSVSPTKGFYKCFGCGKGGNAFTFLMEMEGLNFPEAIERVAEMAGVPLPEPVDDKQYAKNKKRKEEKKQLSEQIVELNKIALEFWEAELQKKNSKAKAAREYLGTRGLSEETQRTFRIGFSPDSWDALLGHLRETGADDALIEQSGLVSVNEEKDRVFDRFRGRIMFPVLDVGGNPVAFGARAMGDDQPKYLNSPETPAYVKGQHLYGLFQSREAIRQKKFAILVEGYLDLIALHQFGIRNTAASLGTAFTPEQARLLGRFTKNVVVNYDGDEAGLKASRSAIQTLLPTGFDVKVFVLPNGADPDDYVREFGADEYNLHRGQALPYIQFVFDRSLNGRNLLNPRHKADALTEVSQVIAAITNPIEKRAAFDQAMSYLKIEKQEANDLWRSLKSNIAPTTDTIKSQARRAAKMRLTVAEQSLLELLIHDGELISRVLPILEPTDWETLLTAPLFRHLDEIHEKGEPVTMETMLEAAGDDDAAADVVPLLFMSEAKREDGEAIDDVLHSAENCVFTLRAMAISNRISDVNQTLIAAERVGDSALVNQLSQEQLDLERMKREMLKKIGEY